MTAWRMAFRAGKNGEELWPACHRLGVAVIEYYAVDDIDLARFEEGEPKSAWSQLAPPQQTSLKRFVYEMKPGDLIYVKQGPRIVGKGEVVGDYRFVKNSKIKDGDGTLWQHQRQVKWVRAFPEVCVTIGRPPIMTLVRLTAADVRLVEQASAMCYPGESEIEGAKTEITQIKTQRSRRLRDQAFKAAISICCVCERDYSKILGGRGVRVLQVHHRKQLSARDKPSLTKISELAVVCANCHLLLHLDPENALRVDELQQMLVADGFLKDA